MELVTLAPVAGVLLLVLLLFGSLPFLSARRKRRARPRELAALLSLEEAVLAHEWTLSSIANAFHLERDDAAETIRRQVEVAALLYETIRAGVGKPISRRGLGRYRHRLLERALARPRARSAERRKELQAFAPLLSIKEPDDQGRAQAVVVEMLQAVA